MCVENCGQNPKAWKAGFFLVQKQKPKSHQKYVLDDCAFQPGLEGIHHGVYPRHPRAPTPDPEAHYAHLGAMESGPSWLSYLVPLAAVPAHQGAPTVPLGVT